VSNLPDPRVQQTRPGRIRLVFGFVELAGPRCWTRGFWALDTRGVGVDFVWEWQDF